MTYWDKDSRAAAVGAVIVSVSLDPDREVIRIATSDGRTFVGRADGDCCSETWVEHLTVPHDIDGAVISEITDSGYGGDHDVEPEACVNHGDRWLDVVRAYQDAIRTTRGEIVIEYRNSSNGYYGGSIEWTVEP